MAGTATLAAPTAHPVDAAIRDRSRGTLPPDQLADYDAITLAFVKYEAGEDDAAREALQAIGLQSQFLEWKVLLRGLIAYSAGDDARAIENWQRLAVDRLPAKIVAPIRVTIDPQYRKAQPLAASLDKQFADLSTGPAALLLPLLGQFGRGKPLAPVFRKAESALPFLQRQAPALMPRLARLFYRAITEHGEPADLARYKKAFGPPSHDPDFHLLEAKAYDRCDQIKPAIQHWKAYEAWLATSPPGWPADQLLAARVIVLQEIAELLADSMISPVDAFRDMFESLMKRSRSVKHTLPPRVTTPRPDPSVYWQKALALDPGCESAALSYFEWLADENRMDEAEGVLRTFLSHKPASAKALGFLAGLLSHAGRPADALAIRVKELAANPLDPTLRAATGLTYVSAARSKLIADDADGALAILRDGASLCEELGIAGFYALRSIAARKLKRTAEADRDQALALAVPNGRLAATLYLATDGLLAKLKPADRKAADQALAAVFAGPAFPREAAQLLLAFDSYAIDHIEYRGQKAQTKKIEDLIIRAIASDAPDLDFEGLLMSLLFRSKLKLVTKLSAALIRRFPQNPTFHVDAAEARLRLGERPFYVRNTVLVAEGILDRGADPRFAPLRQRIQKLIDEFALDTFMDL